MRRKSITEISNNKLDLNLEDKDIIITLLLKRRCSFEGAIDYLLSAIPESTKDDMLGELTVMDRK